MMYVVTWPFFYNICFIILLYNTCLFFINTAPLRAHLFYYALIIFVLGIWRAPLFLFFNDTCLFHNAVFYFFIIITSLTTLFALALRGNVREQLLIFAFLFLWVVAFFFAAQTILLIFFFIEIASLLMFIILLNSYFVLSSHARAAGTLYWFNISLIILFWIALAASLLLFIGISGILHYSFHTLAYIPYILSLLLGFFLKMGLPPLFLWKIDFMRGLNTLFILFYICLYYFAIVFFFFTYWCYYLVTLPTPWLFLLTSCCSVGLLLSCLQQTTSIFIFFALSSLINACLVFLFFFLII